MNEAIHYHMDSADLPWPGPLDADCHNGIGLTEPSDWIDDDSDEAQEAA